MAYMKTDEFKTYYFNTTKYSKKERLVEDFLSIWYSSIDRDFSLATTGYIKKLFNAQNKKAIKIKLQGKGHTPAGIDSFFRCLTNWLNAN